MSSPPSLRAAYEAVLSRQEMLPDAAQRPVVERLQALLDCLANPESAGWRARLGRLFGRLPATTCRGIYLWGSVGRGKTWMMDLFCEQLPASQVQRVHFQHFMRDVEHRLARQRHRERPLEAVAAHYARTTRVLCLDEFQVLDIGDAMILHGLLAALCERGVVLVMTSNTPPARLYEGGLQRERFLPAIALLQARLDVLELAAGPDYRLRELAAANTWLDAAREDSRVRLEGLFDRLAGQSQVRSQVDIEIEGRKLRAIRASHGQAWFDFATLCEGARSAHDYIALAEELHTLFLSDVPVLDAQRDDAARRFIWLVDELYDRDVNLIVSAAAEPSALYRGERLKEPFGRTVSRLTEMRGRDYLSRGHHASVLARPRQ